MTRHAIDDRKCDPPQGFVSGSHDISSRYHYNHLSPPPPNTLPAPFFEGHDCLALGKFIAMFVIRLVCSARGTHISNIPRGTPVSLIIRFMDLYLLCSQGAPSLMFHETNQCTSMLLIWNPLYPQGLVTLRGTDFHPPHPDSSSVMTFPLTSFVGSRKVTPSAIRQ